MALSMSSRLATVLSVLSLSSATRVALVDARLEFVGLVPNGNNVGAAHALGHVAWDGDGPLNDFGKAFAAAGLVWTRSLCRGDADGDGQSNGEELGDPCCTWAAGDAMLPLITDELSHPGDHGSKLNDTALQRRVQRCRDVASAAPTSAVVGTSVAGEASIGSSDDDDHDVAVQNTTGPSMPEPVASGSVARVSRGVDTMPHQAKHTSQLQTELEALLRFYQKTGGAKGKWANDTGWAALEAAAEQTADMLVLRGSLDKQLPLFGAQWDRNHVVAIDLSANGLDGTLPKELASLRSLKQLKLRNNPKLRGQVPPKLYHIRRLQYCYLDGTRLENVLPHHEAHSFQITQLHANSQSPAAGSAATVSFSTGTHETNLTRWVVDMTETELFMVHTALKARHKPHDVDRPATPQRTASNATGPERVEAATKLQRIYRARIARTKFRQFLRSLFDKHVDAATGVEYFVDKRTGESMWARPDFVATTPRKNEDSGGNQEIWQVFDDGHGNTYYWNRLTGESTWEPPVFLSRIYQELRDRYGADKTDDERFELFFHDIDKDGTASIDRDEFARLCGELGMAMAPKQIQNVFDELDTSGDGELSREEIIAWLTRNF